MRLSDVADSYSEFKRSCCSLDAAEDARRVASQLDIPVLHPEPGARVRRGRPAAVPARVPGGPHAESVRRLQHRRSSSGRCWVGPGCSTTATPSRPATTPGRAGGRRPGEHDAGPAPGYRLLRGRDPEQGPELLPLRPRSGGAGPHSLPAGRDDQAAGSRRRPGAGPGDGRQARQPGDLLRARGELPRRPARAGRLEGRARAGDRRRRKAGRRALRRRRVHGRAAAGDWRGPWRAALRVEDRRGREHDQSSAAGRTWRRAGSMSRRSSFVAGAAPAERPMGSGRRSRYGTGVGSPRPRSCRGQRVGGRSGQTNRSGRRRPGRPPSSTEATWSWAAAASPDLNPRPSTEPRSDWRSRPARSCSGASYTRGRGNRTGSGPRAAGRRFPHRACSCLRGQGDARVLVVLVAAALGAWAGDAIGGGWASTRFGSATST